MIAANCADDVQHYYERLARWSTASVRWSIELVTPARAAEWLARMSGNRPKSPATVLIYETRIRKGQWRLNGEPVVLDWDDNCINGQHRAEAVIRAGIAVPMVIVRGVSPEVFQTFDQGRARSAADTLATMSEKKARPLASALAWLYRYLADSMAGKGFRLSNMDIASLLAEYPGMRQSVEYVSERAQKGIHPVGPFSFLHYICMEKHPEHVAFFEKVLSGANIAVESPEHMLFRRLTDRRPEKGSRKGVSFNQVYMVAIAIKAWNASVAGKKIMVLKWLGDESFPVVG